MLEPGVERWSLEGRVAQALRLHVIVWAGRCLCGEKWTLAHQGHEVAQALVRSGHIHCDFDPIECGAQIMEWAFREGRRDGSLDHLIPPA